MNFPRQNDRNEPLRKAEETLRLIAALPAPEGLAERVQSRVRTAPVRSPSADSDLAKPKAAEITPSLVLHTVW